MNGLSVRERRLVALGILLGLVAAVWLLVVAPILGGFANRAEARTEARDDLARDARLVAGFGAARAEAARLEQEAGAWAIAAPSQPLAVEAARERLAKAVTADGGVLQALRTPPASAGRVRLQADLHIPLIALTHLIRRLETDRPFATVDALTVSAPEEGATAPSAPLEVRLELTYAVR